uniref:Calcineurin-like phosphoesterase domain-containing protein n=1 Tax=Helicotheca tamesis TaxID=374047 RepID=A0A7S2GRX7_9STRA|mmetsp:Transcript_10705/g.14984  ORF Transcript_10705/g.14984 Transcript_10705/m.14984 type:complete len:147 (+) Transcript_10705:329-769(+)
MMTSSKKLLTNCIYLENESIKIQGIQFYGSPYTPAIPGKTMAFNYHDRQTAHTIWQKIPQDVDILMTHGPPHQFLDRIIVGKHVGCPKLRQRVMQVQPKFHFFGHIHEGFGIQTYKDVTFVNCATVTLLYQPKHEAVVLDYVTNKR